MKIQFLILILCVVVSVSAYTPPNEYKTISENNTVCYRNLRYGAIPDAIPDSTSDRMLDLYLPETSENMKPLPVFFFVHGGGFRGGNKEAQFPMFQKLVEAGYAVVSINYRLTLKYNNPERVGCRAHTQNGPGTKKFADGLNLAIWNAVEDAQSALKWVSNNAEKFRLDTNRLAVSGGSAGGMTVLYLALASNQTAPAIKAVVNFWGALEDVSLIKTGNNLPAVLTYHGDADDLIHVNFAKALHKRLEEIGDTSSILNIMDGKGHAQYNYTNKYKIDEIIDFLNKVLYPEIPTLISLDYRDLLKNRQDIKDKKPEIMTAYNKLISRANAILKTKPLKITDGDLPPSGDNHDYFSISAYAWPNPDTPDGMPYSIRDGYLNKEAEGDRYDKYRYNLTIYNVNCLSQAWFFTGNEKYVAKAAELLRVWFINPETRMNPAFRCANACPGKQNGVYSGTINGVVLINMLDHVNLLTLSKSWTQNDNEALKKWFAEYSNWLLTDEFGIKESKTTNNHAAYYIAQLASYAIYTGDITAAKKAIERGKEMLNKQMASDGSLPRELGRPNSFHYSLYGLKAFCIMADCANVINEDMWHWTSSDGKSIKSGLDFILPYLVKEKEWTWKNVARDDEKARVNAILFIRRASKIYKTNELRQAENFITCMSPDDSEKVWLLGRNLE